MTKPKANPQHPTPAYCVYPPPMRGLPFLSVAIMPDGSVIARAFRSVEEATTDNQDLIKNKRH
ncbi:MAG: hypothetical protein J0I79_33020 [Mesorhizobium sp.]|uniref:hypothetical protein n=1 Tax=Mesorhizobium sp. TaxID=1871066 RepID=UPI001AC1A343|nr:hypothetical protein [Mesorhizobium sp.]MBN9222779.1 hypothetical protein [Mesorhizobium sp.]